jgi:hypothetical protein
MIQVTDTYRHTLLIQVQDKVCYVGISVTGSVLGEFTSRAANTLAKVDTQTL